MKIISGLMLCLAFLPAFADTPPPAEATSAYQRAVNSYREAAGAEMVALKSQVEELVKTAGTARRDAAENVERALKGCEAAFADLKAAESKDFDRAKAVYESRRGGLLKAMETIKTP